MYLTVGHLVVIITAIAIPMHSPAAQLYNGGERKYRHTTLNEVIATPVVIESRTGHYKFYIHIVFVVRGGVRMTGVFFVLLLLLTLSSSPCSYVQK